jgi:hypothetical protein
MTLQIDPEHLKRHYASLSDEALSELKRHELIGAAQKIYDDERERRQPLAEALADPLPNVRLEPEPDWMKDAACACSFPALPGQYDAPGADLARSVLDAAGIPVYVGAYEEAPPAQWLLISEIRIMIPSRCSIEAESVLDREIYNAQVEDLWKNHFATLSDKEFRELDFEILIGGLTDRIARLRRAYKNELASRSARD